MYSPRCSKTIDVQANPNNSMSSTTTNTTTTTATATTPNAIQTSPFPTVDISPFLRYDASKADLNRTAQSLSTACTSPGFFYLTNHNLSPALSNRVLSLARDFFFHTPATEKEKLKRRDVGVGNGDGARGYQVIGDNVTQGKRDWHEALDYYRPVRDAEPTEDEVGEQPPYDLLQGMNQWPSTPFGFREVYEEFLSKMLGLGTAVVRAMGMALGEGMEDVFVSNTRKSWWVMRAIGYPPLPDDAPEGGVSCGVHSDYGCVTLLLADETKGALQAWVEEEGEGRWVDVDPVEGALVVNIGDMMARWSEGKWKATKHRVVHRGSGYRISVPFFFEPDWDARVPGAEGEGEVVYGEYLSDKVRGNF